MNPRPVAAASIAAFLMGLTDGLSETPLLGTWPEFNDANYYLLDNSFVTGPLVQSVDDLLDLYECREWKNEVNDCDKFDLWSKAMASFLHSRTSRKLNLSPGGLAFGRFFYKPNWSTVNHAINCFLSDAPITSVNPSGLRLGFFDYKRNGIVSLSTDEIRSCFKISF